MSFDGATCVLSACSFGLTNPVPIFSKLARSSISFGSARLPFRLGLHTFAADVIFRYGLTLLFSLERKNTNKHGLSKRVRQVSFCHFVAEYGKNWESDRTRTFFDAKMLAFGNERGTEPCQTSERSSDSSCRFASSSTVFTDSIR